MAADDSGTDIEAAEATMTFASARSQALVLALDATPAERLAWLEEAIEIAYASGALPRSRQRGATRR